MLGGFDDEMVVVAIQTKNAGANEMLPERERDVTGRPDALAAARSSEEDNGTSGVAVEAVWQYFYVVDTCQNALAFPSFFFFFSFAPVAAKRTSSFKQKKKKKRPEKKKKNKN